MSNYPFSFDNDTTLPPVSGSTQEDIAITALRSAVFAVEEELGIVPAGIYPDVRTRLDILESRINFSVPPSFPNDGYVKSPLIIWNTVQQVAMTISDGYGVPTENRVSGSLFMRADGYLNNQLYVNVGPADGYSSLWKPIQTDQWMAGGDLIGTYLKQTVVGLDGYPLKTSVMSHMDGYSDGYNLTWNFGDGYWEPMLGFLANNDLAPAPGSGPVFSLAGNTGRTAQTVVGFQNRKLSPDAPSDGYALIWEGTDNHWDGQALAIIWHNSVATGDGYITRTNIRSNRLKQSPSQNASGRVGMTNFGNSTLNIGGVSADYTSILGGDNNTASGSFAAILGGELNTASDGYALVLDGYNNFAQGRFSTVLNGTLNTVTVNGIESFILDGYSNNVSSFNSFILDGYNNSVAASYAGILNGQNNSVAAANTHAWVGFGSTNTITGSQATYSMILGGSGNTTNSQNVFIGNPTNATVQSPYGAIHAGIGNTIGTFSNFATVVNGSVITINTNSLSAFVGNGLNINVTGNYATVLNANVATVNGANSVIVGGASNSVTATFSTIVNGSSNTISGNPSYASILDGYGHNVTGSGSLILDGYNNTVSGLYSTILNGNTNSISSPNSTILNGSSNTMDSASPNNVVLFGTSNILTGSSRSVVAGNGNTLTNVANSYILGQVNSVQASNVKVMGDSNTVGAGANYIRIFGLSNTITANVTNSTVFGSNNTLAPTNLTHDVVVLGSNNTVDGYGNSVVLGQNHIVSANYSLAQGQFGKARMYGQQVHANSRFTAGKIGEAQWSRVVLTGNGGPGAAFLLQLQDTVPTNMTFTDGYAYELSIRALIASVAPTTPVATASAVLNVLMHQDGGVLVIDNVNREVEVQNGSTWTVSVSGYSVGTPSLTPPTNNQFQIQVDAEQTPFVQGGPATRRAIATVEMREISRI